jgi:hypothetical protein
VIDFAVTMLLAISPAAPDSAAAAACFVATKISGGKQIAKVEKKKRKRGDGDGDDGRQDIGPAVEESEWGPGEMCCCCCCCS